MNVSTIKSNRILNFMFDILILWTSYLFYTNNRSAWIFIPFLSMMICLVMMALVYKSVYRRCFHEIQIDGFLKIIKLLMVTVLLPYSSHWQFLYICILGCLIIIDEIHCWKLYKDIKTNQNTSIYYIVSCMKDSNITIKLLFTHIVPLIFVDSSILIKLMILICVVIYSIKEFKTFYIQYDVSNDLRYFVRACVVYYICFMMTSYMILFGYMNFLYYLITAFSVSGFWKKTYVDKIE